MRARPLRALGSAALLACAACVAAAPEAQGSPQAAAPAPASVPVPAAPPVAPPVAPQAPRFVYAGELTQGGFIRGRAPAGATLAMLGDQPLDLAPDGSFFAAFDRDSAARLTLEARLANGETIREALAISAREWAIQRVNIAKRELRDPEAYWRQREPEHNAIQAARAQVTDATGWMQDFIWPLKGRISGLFGRQRIYRGEPGSFHSGIDIAEATGAPFVAPADGVVVLARTGFSLEGGLIIIDHGAGLTSAFLHASRLAVAQGDVVRQGQHIGDVGSTGRSTGPHLHWGLVWRGARLDPLLLAGPMG